MLQPMHIVQARDHAAHIEGGRAVAVPFSAAAVSEFIGITGQSYIAKLPNEVSEGPLLQIGMQNTAEAGPPGSIEFQPQWANFYRERSRSWLIDIALVSRGDKEGSSQFICRAAGLEKGAVVWTYSTTYTPRELGSNASVPPLRLVGRSEFDVTIGSPIHVASVTTHAHAAGFGGDVLPNEAVTGDGVRVWLRWRQAN